MSKLKMVETVEDTVASYCVPAAVSGEAELMGTIRWGYSKLPPTFEDNVVAQALVADVLEGAVETELAGAEGEGLPDGAGTLERVVDGVGAGALEGVGTLSEGAGAGELEGAGTLSEGAGALLDGAGVGAGAGATLEVPGAGTLGAGAPGQVHSLRVIVCITVVGGPGRGAELAGAEGAGAEEAGTEPAGVDGAGAGAMGVGVATGDDDAPAPVPEQESACNWIFLH